MDPTLRDPWFGGRPPVCASCGYDLRGLPSPCRCPECGRGYELQSLVLTGVTRPFATGSRRVRVAWIILAVSAGVSAQAAPLVGLKSAYAMIAFYVVALIGIIGLLASGRTARAGAERFTITQEGLAREPAVKSAAPQRSEFLSFVGLSVRIDRVGPMWRRLRLGVPDDRRPTFRQVMFDAGFRCSDDDAAEVQSIIDSFISAANSNINSPAPLNPSAAQSHSP